MYVRTIQNDKFEPISIIPSYNIKLRVLKQSISIFGGYIICELYNDMLVYHNNKVALPFEAA